MLSLSKSQWVGAAFIFLLAAGMGFLAGWFIPRSATPPTDNGHTTNTTPDNTIDYTSTSRWFRDADPALVEEIMREIQPENIEHNLRFLSAVPRVAGTATDRAQAELLKEQFLGNGMDDAGTEPYSVLLSYPGNSSFPNKVSILSRTGKVEYEASSHEEPVPPYHEELHIPPYNAYSKAGTVQGEIVYANFADEQDFTVLEQNYSISVRGRIVLARYGWISLSEKANNAAQHGALGLILFADPYHDAVEGPNNVFPKDWWLPPTGVRRGTISMMPGDPLTQGYPAKDFAYRDPVFDNPRILSSIPVQPVSYGAAQRLFQSMHHHSPPIPESWRQWNVNNTTDRTGWKNVMKLGGSMKRGRTVELVVNNELVQKTVYNAFAIMLGEIEPDRFVLMGNHRDAWGYGAVDPGGGTAVMLELTRVLGSMRKQGWRPRRTLIVCSWAAEEFSLIGSTEWVEEKLKILQHKAVAYLNVDIAVTGTETLDASASPMLHDLIYRVTQQVSHPHFPNMFDAWLNYTMSEQGGAPRISKLHPNSDFAPFYFTAGVPSASLYYAKKQTSLYPVYHTGYDTFDYVKLHIDPTFEYHAMIAKLMGVMAYRLLDTPILPLDVRPYGHLVMESFINFKQMLVYFDNFQWFQAVQGHDLLKQLEYCVFNFSYTAENFHQMLEASNIENPYLLRKVSDQLMLVERAFIDERWARDRQSSYSHVLFSPGDQGCPWLYCCPGLNDALCDKRVRPYLKTEHMPDEGYRLVHRQVATVCHALNSARDMLIL